MRKRSLFSAAIAAVASLSIATSAFAFSGIENGSFEVGTPSGNPFDTLHPGSTSLTAWVVESGSIDWIGSFWPASDGSRSIDLSGDGPGAISQSLATTAGNTYTVTFDLSGNPQCGPAVKTGTVNATGGASDTLSYDTSAAGNTVSDMKWVEHTYEFVATAATTTVTFTSTTPTQCGPAMDNVDVTETAAPPPDPEPSHEPTTQADCKDGGWTAFVDGVGTHFKNQGDCVSYVATDHRNAAATRAALGTTQREAKANPGDAASHASPTTQSGEPAAGKSRSKHLALSAREATALRRPQHEGITR